MVVHGYSLGVSREKEERERERERLDMNDEFTRVKLWKQTWEDFTEKPIFNPENPEQGTWSEWKLNWIMNNKCVMFLVRCAVEWCFCSIIITLSHLNIKIEAVETSIPGGGERRIDEVFNQHVVRVPLLFRVKLISPSGGGVAGHVMDRGIIIVHNL